MSAKDPGEGRSTDAGGAPATSIDEFIRSVAHVATEVVPATIGRYRVHGRLGAGGMGVVYAAHDPRGIIGAPCVRDSTPCDLAHARCVGGVTVRPVVHAGVLYYVAQSGDAPPDQLWRVTGPDAAPELIIDTHTSNDEHDDASNPVGAPLVAPDGQIYIVTDKRVISLGGDTVIEPPVPVTQVAVDDTYVYVAGGASVWRAPR